jgi:hypothetical protein
VGGPVGGHESVLHGVSGLLAVAQSTQGDGPEAVTMTAYQLGEGFRVASHMKADQLGIGRR